MGLPLIRALAASATRHLALPLDISGQNATFALQCPYQPPKDLTLGGFTNFHMRTISKDELSKKLGSPDLMVVNVLASPAYEKIRIKGSISMPRMDLESGRWKELPKSKEIVVHCSSYECGASRMAAEFLEGKGYNVAAYEGGIKEWAEAGLPMEGTISPQQYLVEKYGKPTLKAS